jgi:YVTN family beta-propeller protein
VLAAWLASGVPAFGAPAAYVPNHGEGTVSVVDTANNAVVTTITVGSEPLGAAVDPAGARAYVTNQVAIDGTVSVIDTALNGVVATVHVGVGPSGVAVKLPGDRVYVTNRDDKNVSVIDTASLAVVKTIDVGNNPLGIAVNPAGTPAYVVNKGTNDVTVIDTESNAVLVTVPVGNDPSHVAVSPDGHRVYVTNNSNSSVSVIDAGTNAVVDTIPVGAQPEGVTFAPNGTRAYVANSGPGSVSVIDTATNAVVDTVDVGTTPFELSLRPDGTRLFVSNRGGSNVSVIDTASNTVATTVSVGLNPAGFGQFVVPALGVPSFGDVARKCQIALAREGGKFAKTDHKLQVACQLGRVNAEAAGHGTAAADAACQLALDLGNPSSKLAIARTKALVAVAKRCSTVAPRQINAPCRRSAQGLAETTSCLFDQHVTRVQEMIDDEFSATRPSPLGTEARRCQTTLAKAGQRFAEKLHKELVKCVEKLLVAADKRVSDAKVIAGCRAKLDLGNPRSALAAARAAGIAKIVGKCAGQSAADLGAPCDAEATTIPATAACVVDGHDARVARMVAAECNDACTMLTRAGVARTHPAVCLGP